MGRVVKVDWAELSQFGNEFLEQSEEMGKIKEELSSTFELLDSAWKNVDTAKFKTNCNALVDKIDFESFYLNAWYEYLTKTARKYNGNMEDGLSSIKRIECMYRND